MKVAGDGNHDPSGIHSSWMESPATDWRDATPFGNGALGALHFGGIAHDRVLLNHERLYGGARTPSLPDISHELAGLRTLLENGDYLRANDLYANAWKECGYDPEDARYLPGPIFHWQQPVSGVPTGYRRWLDFADGVGGMEWLVDGQGFSRLCWVSGPDQCVIYVPDPRQANGARAWFSAQDISENTDDKGRQLPLDVRLEITNGDAWMVAIQHGPDDAKCAAVVFFDGMREIRQQGAVFDMRPGRNPRCFLSVLMEVSPAAIAAEVERLESVAAKFDGGAAHRGTHRERYDRCRFDLDVRQGNFSNDELLLLARRGEVPDALVARMANFGRYLLIASSNTGTLPPNLQGIWNGNFQPPWWGGFFFNENVQMALLPALPGGLPESMATLFDLLESHMDDFRENARKLFGCGGILPPLFMSPDSGLKKNPQAHVLYWTGSGAWLARLYFDFWNYTRDEHFLHKRLLPFMSEVAAFYIDFFQEGTDGILHSSPSNSPENAPLGHVNASGVPLRVCVDATMDFALARELFGNLLIVSQSAGLGETDDTRKWSKFVAKLPAYRINEDGAIAEWIDPQLKDNYHHRHLAHLYPLFPGDEILPGDSEIFDACRVAVEKRLVVGLESQTGWSLAHMAHVYGRLNQPARAVESLDLLCRFVVGPNLFTAHNDLHDMGVTMPLRKGLKPTVQTEANQGFTSACYEMLVRAARGRLYLFPALPARWQAGSLRGLRLPAQGSLDLAWDRRAGSWSAEIKGSEWDVELPAGCVLSHDTRRGPQRKLSGSFQACQEISEDLVLASR
jgi:alpha-L-fucosidase 2